MDMENRKELPKTISSGQLVRKKYNVVFFLNGDLHRLVKKNAAANVCYALNYKTEEIVKYTYSDYKRFSKPAYKISEVAKILRRHKERVRLAFHDGHIKKPVLVNYNNRTGVYYFSEEDIYELRDYFASVHRGRPRFDGIVVSKNVPSIAELDALFGKTQTLYIRTKDGNFVPTWKAEEYE